MSQQGTTPAFDCSRSDVLNFQFPPPRFSPSLSTGSTNSEWKRSWRELRFWTEADIALQLGNYWNSVSDQDKSALVCYRTTFASLISYCLNLPPAAVEATVRLQFDIGISNVHRVVVSNDDGQSMPTDLHSTIRLYQGGVLGNPDYLLHNQHSGAVKGICEAKSPWNIGPQQIEEVLMGKQNISVNFANKVVNTSLTHKGRLAIEQIYGYMCWNSQAFGILTTTSGFVFLRREDNGILYMSRMFASNSMLAPYGYIMPETLVPGMNFTISHILYWFTRLTEVTPTVVETAIAGAVTTLNTYQPAPAPQSNVGVTYQSQHLNQGSSNQGLHYGQGYTQNQSLERFKEGFKLDFKPWEVKNYLGGQVWYANLLVPDECAVVVKCWDAYTQGAGNRDNEVDNYMRIQSLWGICVPRLFGKGEIDFCHAMILERIDVRTSRKFR